MNAPRQFVREGSRPLPGGGLAALLLVLAVVVTYAGSMGGAFVFDDIPAILENPTLRHPGDVAGLVSAPGDQAGTVGGRPVLNLSLALNYALGGTAPWGYHALNILIHAGGALLLYGILRRTLDGGSSSRPVASSGPGDSLAWRSPWSGREAQGLAFLAALLWAVHPLQTEGVTYVIQRAESLMGFFYLLTLYGFIRFADRGHGSRAWAVVSVLACLLGMATKEVMVSAPLVVLLYDRTFVAGSVARAWRSRRAYYSCLAATWLPLAILVAGTHGRGGSAGFGSPGQVWPFALTQCRAVVHYLRLVFWPDPLVFDYGTALVRQPGAVVLPFLVLLLLLAGTAIALRRRPAVGFAALFFFALLAPSSSFVPIATEPVAEHRMYLPLAAVSVLVVVGTAAVLSRLMRRRWRAALGALGIAAAVSLGSATVLRNRDYRSETTLWSDTVRKEPANPRAHNNLAESLRAAGESARAKEEFEAAVEADPDYAPAQFNLGVTLLDSGRAAEAVPHLEKAMAAPRHQAEIRLCLGEAFERTGRHAEAAASFREALALAPASEEAAFGLANNLAGLGRYAEAVAPFRTAVALAPDRASVRNNLANDLLFSGDVDGAILEYQEALRRDPQNASVRENLGLALRARRTRDGR
jgi:tetratricopeptide (TPR) repeat protein